MSQHSLSERLLTTVRRRMTIRRLAARLFRALLVFSILYLIALVIGRLTGLFPGWFPAWTVVIPPALAGVVAVLIPSRVSLRDAAHCVDEFHQTKDLFLTSSLLGESTSDYAPLVHRDAEQFASHVTARKVVPYHWEQPSLVACAVLGVLLLGTSLVPTLDPFGKVAAANETQELKKQLEATRESTKERVRQIARKDVEEQNSDDVTEALEGLKTAFQKMSPNDSRQNLEKLNVHQKEIGARYRKIQSGEMKSLMSKSMDGQQLGQLGNEDQFQQWQKDLQNGSSESLQQALQKVQEQMQELARTDDPVKRTELERQMRKQLSELADFAAKKAGSQSLNAALQRAMEQAKAAGNKELSKEALQALQESLNLADKEMQMLAQSSRDLKSLEEALKLISMAKQCNGKCPKENMSDAQLALSDYAKLYQEMMGSMQGQQRGEREEGGPPVDEDETAETGFKDEKSPAALQKGKILLSLKTKGLSEAGEMKDQDYKRIVGEIRQSLDEAISQEEIPPGYVDGIKKYFDTLKNE